LVEKWQKCPGGRVIDIETHVSKNKINMAKSNNDDLNNNSETSLTPLSIQKFKPAL
jgi:hypothetical protein